MAEEKKAKFLSLIMGRVQTKAGNNRLLTKEEHDKIITRLRVLQGGADKKNLKDLNNYKSYEFADYNGSYVLYKRNTTERAVPAEEIFDILASAHGATGHGGRDVMWKHLHGKFHNITKEQVMLFINLCEECQLKRVRAKKSIVTRPILSKELNSRCQVILEYQVARWCQVDGVLNSNNW